MGKAALDLPDPLEQPSTGTSTPASADDLLSQLAGDEIDRLLAEAETERPGATATAPEPAPSAANETIPQDPPAALDRAPFAAAAPENHAVAEQLDALFSQLDQSDSAPSADAPSADAPVADAPAPASAADALTVAQADPLDQAISQAAPSLLPRINEDQTSGSSNEASAAPVAGSDAGTTAAERSLLDAINPTAQAEDSEAEQSAELDIDALDAPLPIYFKPLVWINAPFDALSPGLRESLGKAAVLTLVNAIAVLLYVLIFRR